jgi:hypothetical protein
VRSRHPLAVGAAALVTSLLLGGCFTGERPSFVEASDEPTGDAAVDAVVDLLESPDAGTFTATYQITNKYGGATFPATVTRDDTRLSITIGDVRYLSTEAGTQTCAVSTGACTSGFDEARISDTGVLHTFAKDSAANRLRREAATRTGPGETYQATIGEQQVECVKVVGAGGTTQFCALPGGWLASQDVAEVNIALQTLAPTATEALFTPSGV